MLCDDDVERILESGEEAGLKLTEADARAVWEAYENKDGKGHKMLPISFNELMDIVQNVAREIGVGGTCALTKS